MTYYNECEPFAAEWIGNLYPGSKIDTRSIKDVSASDVRGFRRAHFFAGIAGWELALNLAGWPADREVWSGSAPCQPYSAAGKGKGDADERNLWPEFFRLIRECRPSVVFGEQVASGDVIGTELEAAFVAAVQSGDYGRANGIAERIAAKLDDDEPVESLTRRWLDGISADLASEGYTVWAAVVGAHSVGGPHIRQRLYWVAESNDERYDRRQDSTRTRKPKQHHEIKAGAEHHRLRRLADADISLVRGLPRAGEQSEHERDGGDGWLGDTHPRGLGAGSEQPARQFEQGRGVDGLGDAGGTRLQDRRDSGRGAANLQREAAERNRVGDAASQYESRHGEPEPMLRRPSEAGGSGTWSDYTIIPCTDGKSRRAQPSSFPLVAGIPQKLGSFISRLRAMGISAADVKLARRNRTGRLKGYGNAICAPLAAEFIRAFLECEQ